MSSMSSIEWPIEASWEGVQRQGLDIADRFNSMAQGFTCLINSQFNSPAFSWPVKPPLPEAQFSIDDNVSAIFDIGNRLGQAGAEFGACLTGMVDQFFSILPLGQNQEDRIGVLGSTDRRGRSGEGAGRGSRVNFEARRGARENSISADSSAGEATLDGIGSVWAAAREGETLVEEDELGPDGRSSSAPFGHTQNQGSINITSVFDSRTRGIESSIVARGDLWRAEASHSSSTSRSDSSPLFLLQLGPVLFVRDTTLLLPVHLSKQHLLWYGFDRKKGVHSLCPAVWSKQRSWLMMSMICLNPIACTFMDLQFPNGQLTYVSGEGLSTSAFLPLGGGLLQVQSRFPGETKLSFSCKNKYRAKFTTMLQLPDGSLTFGVTQALAWQRSGLMVRPTVQFSVSPTFGGSNPGLQTELMHSINENFNIACGYSCSRHPAAFASVAFGRSKWNGRVGSSSVVMKVEVPTTHRARPSFTIQMNTGIDL